MNDHEETIRHLSERLDVERSRSEMYRDMATDAFEAWYPRVLKDFFTGGPIRRAFAGLFSSPKL